MAARNSQPFDWIEPVLLYRNGQAGLVGAYSQMDDGKEVVFTAAHGFSIDYPPCVWSYRKVIPEGLGRRFISKAVPMRGTDDDVAVCTPASVIQTTTQPLQNFYAGLRRGAEFPQIEFGQPLAGSARSVLTGEDVRLLGETTIGGKLHVALDYEASEGQSGSVFVDEPNSRMYVLRLYSPQLSRILKHEYNRHSVPLERGVTFAIRLAFA